MALTSADLPKLVELLNLIDIRVQVRRKTAAAWTASDEVLLAGEWGKETDTGKLKQGDGATGWTALDYFSAGTALGAVNAGSGIEIDDTNPQVPVISSTLGSIALAGRVATYAVLPSIGVASGDAYYVESDGLIYIWDGSAWPANGAGVSVSGGASAAYTKINLSDFSTIYEGAVFTRSVTEYSKGTLLKIRTSGGQDRTYIQGKMIPSGDFQFAQRIRFANTVGYQRGGIGISDGTKVMGVLINELGQAICYYGNNLTSWGGLHGTSLAVNYNAIVSIRRTAGVYYFEAQAAADYELLGPDAKTLLYSSNLSSFFTSPPTVMGPMFELYNNGAVDQSLLLIGYPSAF